MMNENPYQSPAAELELTRTSRPPSRLTRLYARLTRFFVSMALMLGYNIAMYMILPRLGMKLFHVIIATVVGAVLLIRFLGKSWAAMEQRLATGGERTQ